MKKPDNNKNIFDELDKKMEQMETERKLFKWERILKITIKIFRGFIIFLFMLSASFICLGIFNGQNIADISMGIICLISAVHCLVFLKLISKSKIKTGEKR